MQNIPTKDRDIKRRRATDTGYQIFQEPAFNKSTGFSREEREALNLRGLLPAAVLTQEMQQRRILENLRRQPNDIGRYIQLSALQDRNLQLFHKTLSDNIVELLPIVYTPTVGQACREFAHNFRGPKGFYVTPDDRGDIRKILDNWPEDDVRIVVVTDGERILGLGDLGANGMGIPLGKLALYVACAGIHPAHCLPVMFDVGTENEEIRNDPLYLGIKSTRLRGSAYVELMDEFVAAVTDRYPGVLIQFEDFLTPNAFALLNRYRQKTLCFNDDIQGTAAVALAGIYASTRISSTDFCDLKIMFLGAGSAATGIADLVVQAYVAAGLDETSARQRLWFVDVQGLVTQDRTDLMAHNLPYAHEHPHMDFLHSIKSIQPNILIGATGSPNTFTEQVVRAMCDNVDRPAIFALSNPTSRAECTAEQAYTWSDGKAIYASGSPFDSVNYGDKKFLPGQGNNAYIFPGVGLGAILAKAHHISETMFLRAARALADEVSEADLSVGAIYPPLADIRAVSHAIAKQVAQAAMDEGLAQIDQGSDLDAMINDYEYDPTY